MQPEEIICAPFTIWIAPVGTAFPTLSVEPGEAWTRIGSNGTRSYSEDGVIGQHIRRNETTVPAGNQAPSNSFTSSEEYRVRVQLLDMTLEQYAHALGANAVSVNPAVTGVSGFKVIGLSLRAREDARFALLIRGPSPYSEGGVAQFELPIVKEAGAGPQTVFRRGSPVGIAIEFVALENPDATSADQLFGRLVAEDDSIPLAPVFTVDPSISGTAQVGQTLTGSDGTITGGSVSARQWLRDGVAISGATSGTYILVEADEGAEITFRVTAIGAGGTTQATSAAIGPVAASPYGQSAIYNAGTAGTFFVDAINGDNGNAGTSAEAAKATIGAALTAANSAGGDQVIRVMGDGVKYREALSFTSWSGGMTSLKIAGYGTDRPVMSGANVVTGWVPCVSGDSAVVGVNWANIYKVTVSTSSFPAPKYWRTLLSENGTVLPICGLRRAARTTPDFYTDNIDQTTYGSQTTGLTFGLRAGVWYDTITHVGTLDSYTDTQLEQTTAVVHAFPNITGYMEVTSVSSGVLQLETLNLRPSAGGADGAYALLNLLPNIAQGEWGYRNNGDGTVTLYCWPNDAANLTANMELAVRGSLIRINRSGSNLPVEIEGMNFEMVAGGGTIPMAVRVDDNLGLTGNTVAVRQCRFDRFACEFALEMRFVESAATIQNVTFSNGVGFGLGTVPGASNFLFGYRVRNCLATDLSQAGFRMFGVRDCVMTDIRSYRTSGGGHANAINFYQGCDRVAVVNYNGGISAETRLFDGYATNQNSSRIYWLHSTFTLSNDGRGYVDQSGTGAVHPTPGAGGALINCWVPHMPDRLAGVGVGGITVGRDVMPWELYNNVTPAIVNTGGTLTRKGNILTNSASTGDASESLASATDLHVDPANFNFAAKAGSVLNSATGEDVTTIIETLEGWFPGEDFRRDALGRVWNPASPGVGPYGSSWA